MWNYGLLDFGAHSCYVNCMKKIIHLVEREKKRGREEREREEREREERREKRGRVLSQILFFPQSSPL